MESELVTVTDATGTRYGVVDGQPMSMRFGDLTIHGHVVTFNGRAWLKENPRSIWVFDQGRILIPNPKPIQRWQLGAIYRSIAVARLVNNKLLAIHRYPQGVWLTFERRSADGRFLTIFTAREAELHSYHMIEAAPKDYDPTHQPYEDGDI